MNQLLFQEIHHKQTNTEVNNMYELVTISSNTSHTD